MPDNVETWQLVVGLVTGVGIAAASGFRVFLPLLARALAAVSFFLACAVRFWRKGPILLKRSIMAASSGTVFQAAWSPASSERRCFSRFSGAERISSAALSSAAWVSSPEAWSGWDKRQRSE